MSDYTEPNYVAMRVSDEALDAYLRNMKQVLPTLTGKVRQAYEREITSVTLQRKALRRKAGAKPD